MSLLIVGLLLVLVGKSYALSEDLRQVLGKPALKGNYECAAVVVITGLAIAGIAADRLDT